MQLLKMNVNGQVTIPVGLRRKLHCREGDYFQVEIENSGLRLIPAKIVDPSQAWFWTKEWQEKEREAEEDLRSGRHKKFKGTKEAIKHLASLAK